MTKELFTFIFLIFLSSCANQNQEKKQLTTTIKNPKFETFLKNFQEIKIGQTFETTCFDPNKNCKKLDKNSAFLNVDMGISIGKLIKNKEYQALIYGIAASCYMLNLATFDNNGKIIDNVSISEGCGAGPGYLCDEKIKINSANVIETKSEIQTYEFDTLGEEIPNTRKKELTIFTYTILKSGKIKKEISTFKK